MQAASSRFKLIFFAMLFGAMVYRCEAQDMPEPTAAETAPSYTADPAFQSVYAAAKEAGLTREERMARWKKANELAKNQCMECFRGVIDGEFHFHQWKDAVANSVLMDGLAVEKSDKMYAEASAGRALMFPPSTGMTLEQVTRAEGYLKSALAISPRSSLLLFQEGRALATMHREDEAKAMFQRFLDAVSADNASRPLAEQYVKDPTQASLKLGVAEVATSKTATTLKEDTASAKGDLPAVIAAVKVPVPTVYLRHFYWQVKLDKTGAMLRRDWYQTSPSTWEEFYSDGRHESLKVSKTSEVLEGNRGVVVVSAGSDTKRFIPDIDCYGAWPTWLRTQHPNATKWDYTADLQGDEAFLPSSGPESDPKFHKALAEARDRKVSSEEQLARWKHVNKLSNNQCVYCLHALVAMQMKEGQWKDAANTAALMQAVAVEPQAKFYAAGERGRALMHGNYEHPKPEQLTEADSVFKVALAINPKSKEVLYSDGRTLAMMGRFGEAKQQFVQYLELAEYSDKYRTRVEHFVEDPQLAALTMAPPFTLTTNDGEQIQLDDMKGKVVLLDFWATWCGPCKETTPEIKKLAKKFAGQPLIVISISSDRDEQIWKNYIEKNGMDWPQYRDTNGSLSSMYGVSAIPRFFTIDTDGVLKNVNVGSNSTADVEAEIRKLVGKASKAEKAKDKVGVD